MSKGSLKKFAPDSGFVFRNPIILSAISLDLFAVLFGGAVALLPIFADEILMVGKEGLGILRSAPSVGALLMAVYITHHPIMKNTGKILLVLRRRFWCEHDIFCPVYKLLAFIIFIDVEWNV
jgi:hypothetical protein